MIKIDAADMRIIERNHQRYAGIYERIRAYRMASTAANVALSIDGYAIVYDEPLLYDDEIWSFEPGCFSHSLRSNNEIYLQYDHDEGQRLASTRNALRFADDENGLAFRVELDDIENSASIKRMVDSGRRAAVSVGIKNEHTYTKIIGKHRVRFIAKADLIECSLVGQGKCADAFAGVVRSDLEDLTPGEKGPMFKLNFAGHRIQRLRDIAAKRGNVIRELSTRLDRACTNLDRQPAMTLSQSNHLQTLETERLQKHARQHAC